MTSGAKTIDLVKRYGGKKEAPKRFFESFLAILEIIALACKKNAIFSKFDLE